MQESMEIMKQCVGKYRIPEPTRLAHLLVNRERIASGLMPDQNKLFTLNRYFS